MVCAVYEDDGNSDLSRIILQKDGHLYYQSGGTWVSIDWGQVILIRILSGERFRNFMEKSMLKFRNSRIHPLGKTTLLLFNLRILLYDMELLYALTFLEI